MKQNMINNITKNLNISATEHDKEKNIQFAQAKQILKNFQLEQLKNTHEELLFNPDTRKAAHFFLNEIYGSSSIQDRHRDLNKLIPTMEKVFPEKALEIVDNAIELHSLTEVLDNKMVERLGANFSAEDYQKAYVEVTSQEERKKQLELVKKVGLALCGLVQIPLISTTLKVMSLPARLGGLSDLHNFLEKGFYTFKETKNPCDFIEKVVTKEYQAMYVMFDKKASLNKPSV